jgi:ABC-type phosphate transport system ATPase subunit
MLATHNLFQVRRLASTVIFLKKGRLVEAGPTEDIFERAKNEETRLFMSGKDYF